MVRVLKWLEASALFLSNMNAVNASGLASGSFRKDAFLSQFPEQGTKDPSAGRRVHLVLSLSDVLNNNSSNNNNTVPTLALKSSVSSVKINGQEALDLDSSSTADLTYFDWARVHSNPATEQLWVSFHSRNTDWFKDEETEGTVTFSVDVTLTGDDDDATIVSNFTVTCPETATTANGEEGQQQQRRLAGQDQPRVEATGLEAETSDPGLSVTYVTFRNAGTEAIVHLRNPSASASQVISSVVFNGLNISGSDLRPPLPLTLTPNARATLQVPLTSAVASKGTGDVWTLSVADSDSTTWGFGGRHVGERFPIMAWPQSSDCPVPGANATNAAQLAKLGIDSVYYSGKDFASKCSGNFSTEIDSWATSTTTSSLSESASSVNRSWFHAFTDTDTASAVDSAALASHVDAIFIGDEVDGDIDASHFRPQLQKALDAYEKVPQAAVYQGAKTNHNVGAFAGLSDIQGIDAYCAACAPTMLAVVHELPIHYPFYYLDNARRNMMPNTMWGYSQFYSHGWSYQGNANELVAEIFQTVLSGSKAMMLFQSEADLFAQHDTSATGDAVRSVRAVGDILREGDVDGIGFTLSEKNNADVMVGVIRSPDQLAVVTINTQAHGYSNLLCHTELLDRHWSFEEHHLKSVTLHLSSVVGVSALQNWQEVLPGGASVPLNASTGVTVATEGTDVIVGSIDLSTKFPGRIFTASVVHR